MNFVRLIPVILSLLVLGAHFLRDGQTLIVAACIGLVMLLWLRTRWVPRVIQLVLVLGAVEWLWTLYAFATIRAAHGQPWTRLAIILGGVALFTAASALVFRNKALKKRYRMGSNELL